MTDTRSQPWYLQLHYQILAAMLIGVACGLIGGDTAAGWLGWMGTIFVRLLRMVIVPLILTSIISGVSAVGGGKALGRQLLLTDGKFEEAERVFESAAEDLHSVGAHWLGGTTSFQLARMKHRRGAASEEIANLRNILEHDIHNGNHGRAVDVDGDAVQPPGKSGRNLAEKNPGHDA